MAWRIPNLRRIRRDVFVIFLIVFVFTTIMRINDVQHFSVRPSIPRTKVNGTVRMRFKLQLRNDTCYPTTPINITTDYNTFDIYRYEIAHESKPSKNVPPRRRNMKKLKVFVVPFTHVDPGWLNTFDSYSKDTDSILDNMHRFMTQHEKMRFIWTELVFLERWWSKQNSSIRNDIRGLLRSGRLELASGSWVMTDEANVYYPVTMDNIIEGHQFIANEIWENESLDSLTPTVVWSNDPFGYSNTVPYLFTQAGISRSIINRIHRDIKNYLQFKRAIPFRWRQYFDKDGKADMLTHVLPYAHYDILNSCGPNPFVCCEFDFKRLTHWSCPGAKPAPITKHNVKIKAKSLLTQIKLMSQMYESNVILMMLGDDFRFDSIEEWHQQYDNFIPLFDEINSGNDAEIRFATLSDYFNELEQWYGSNNCRPPTLSGDFFPYKCSSGDVWVGYFSTRPFIKRQGRITHSLIRAADLISAQAWSLMNETQRVEVQKKLQDARRELSLFQHHDAITGTSRQHVMSDYSVRLHNAGAIARSVFESAASILAGSPVVMSEYARTHTETETLSTVNIIQSGTVILNVYNSLPYDIDEIVTVRVNTENVSVKNDDGELNAQIEPYLHLGKIKQNTFLLVFRCTLRALSTSTFFLTHDTQRKLTRITNILTTENYQKLLSKKIPRIFTIETINQTDFVVENDHIKTFQDNENPMITHILSKSSSQTTMKLSFYRYSPATGGPYIMRVYSPAKLYQSKQISGFIAKGELQQTAHLFYQSVYERIVLKNLESSLAQQVNVFLRVDITNENNTEFAMRLQTGLENSHFYVDSAGLQLLRREYHKKLPIPENFYPMPTASVLENNSTRITVATNIEHGVSPLEEGMEIILDRIQNQDDGKGLGSDPKSLLTDLLPNELRFSILVEDIKQPMTELYSTYHTPAGHLSVQNLLYPPVVTTSTDAIPALRYQSALPCNYQLLTVRPVVNSKRLMIIFNNGITCRTNTTTTCNGDLQTSLIGYLRSLNVVKVQEANSVGLKFTTEEVLLENYRPAVEPCKFLTLLLTYSS